MAQHFIVAISGFEGAESAVHVFPPDANPADLDAASEATLYAVGVFDGRTGVVKIVDCGYATAGAARTVWPDAVGPTV